MTFETWHREINYSVKLPDSIPNIISARKRLSVTLPEEKTSIEKSSIFDSNMSKILLEYDT